MPWDRGRTIGCMSEAQEQQAVIQYCELKGLPCFHIPNGGFRNKREAANLKRQGVKPGVPDLFIPVAVGFHGLFIEMKACKGGRVSDAQRRWIHELRRQGYCAYVCNGAHDAMVLIERYMAGEVSQPVEKAVKPTFTA